MFDVDHRRLLRCLRSLNCYVIISGYWSQMYAETLHDWRALTYQASTRGGAPATEWIWMNYPPPLELHDYRFLGATFRERERIKRKRNRWQTRLLSMPDLERHAILSAISELRTSITL